MLKTFTIDNFRLFNQFEIASLKRVNLLVGKNNSGKSALLEALELYSSNAAYSTLQKLISDRNENWSKNGQLDLKHYMDVPMRHLFRGHRLPEVGNRGIHLGQGSDETVVLRLYLAGYQVSQDENGTIRRNLISSSETHELLGEDNIEIALVAHDFQSIRRIKSLGQSVTGYNKSRSLIDVEPKLPYQIVPMHNISAREIATLWDMVGLTPLAPEVIKGLQLIDPCITGILFVESSEHPGIRIPLISSTNSSEPLPLKSLGDGITRLFNIIVALVCAKNGILLIDEFENGLHWSVQEAVWKTIFRLANHLNVQVFATTHSRDCVSGFQAAWENNEDAGAFFRLQLDKDGNPRAKAYALETLSDSLDTDTEVR